MRRILNEVGRYAASLWSAAIRGWDAFFFNPADPTAIGLIRIIAGLLACWSLFIFGLDLSDYFGSAGWAPGSAAAALARPHSWSFWFYVSDGWLRLVWCVCLVILALFTLGIFSRLTGILAWTIWVSTVHRVPMALFGFDQVLSALLLYLAMTLSAGQALSFDRFIRRFRARRAGARSVQTGGAKHGVPGLIEPDGPGVPAPSVGANLAIRLIQIHLVIIYAMAGMSKLQGPSWWTGLALWKTMATGEFVRFDFTPLAASPLLINLLTHGSLLLELLYPILIWIKILRPLVLCSVSCLHIGIAVVNPGLTEFAIAMLAANLAFVSGAWLRSVATGESA